MFWAKISKKGGNAPRATDLDYKWYVVEKKQILRKPLYCTWELNTYSTEHTADWVTAVIHSSRFFYLF
jgi:hypothetical protein